MADKPQPITAPHSTVTTPPLNPPYTPSATSIPDDSETEYAPTPPSSLGGGPQYEDLPPSYDFALSDARNGIASLDASQIEAHRVSANEGPDEPEVWEYRMRGESAEADGAHEHEEAPAYERHVPVQHVASSESIPVGRVGNANPSSTSTDRSAAGSDDPPHSVPEVEVESGPASGFNPSWSNERVQHHNLDGRGAHGRSPWPPFGEPGNGPFGAPGNGPFGAPGNGPFGASGNGPFGRPGRGPFGSPGHGPFGRGRGRGSCRSTGSRSGPPQDWTTFGQNLGRMGEEFGRRMGNWGEQLGRQAGAMGEQFGRQVGARGQQFGRDTGAWAAAYSGRAAGAQAPPVAAPAAGPSNGARSEPPQYDEPPSYQGPAGVAGQETGVLHGDRKVNTYPPEKVPEMSSEKLSEKTLGKQKANDYDDDDSSISSDSSDSSISSSDSDDDDYDDAQAAFLKRIDSINRDAESAASKGKKSREEIEHERDLAIAKATREREAREWKVARRQSRRNQRRDLRNRRRELMREYRQKKRDLREKSDVKGKGKGKAKKSKEWKELKSEYKAKRRALKRERIDARREWKRERREDKRARKESFSSGKSEQKVLRENV